MKTLGRLFSVSRRLAIVFGLWSAAAAWAPAQTPPPNQHLNIPAKDMKWDSIFPELGEGSPKITMLRIDPTTKATQLMIRVPKNFHVPQHWHTANETHTVVSGTFVIEAEGKREALGPGSFNYVPAKMPHEAWTKKSEG